MAFKRATVRIDQPGADELTTDMIGIGMLFAGEANPSANIEDTLFFASSEGMNRDDFRVLSILTTWLGLHTRYVNADRLTGLVSERGSPRVRLYWSAIAHWHAADKRFARLRSLHQGGREDLFSPGTDFQLRRYGEDPRFAGGPLRVDGKILRDRAADVMTVDELAKQHRAYFWRVLLGPTYRADLVAALEESPTASAADIARRTYSSFSTAWETKNDVSHLPDLFRRLRRPKSS